MNDQDPGFDTYDHVIVGGGTAGCVLANRLSENPRRRVLLIEAGRSGRGVLVSMPAGFFKLMSDPARNWMFRSEPEPGLGGRVLPMPRGKGLGGSSMINAMIYCRGNPADFDGWAQMGASDYSYHHMVPWFRKAETWGGARGPDRGETGPLPVNEQDERPILAETFLSAASAEGYETGHDYNGGSQDGFAYLQLNQKRGRRWSAERAYLRPVRSRPNLHVVTGAHATNIVLEGRRAVGVRFLFGGEAFVARTGGEVILAAGAVQSPQLLELSGIGDPERLAAFGIEILHSLPQVGENYHDHFAPRLSWRVKQRVSLNERTRGWPLAIEAARYFFQRRGLLTNGAGVVGGWLRSRPDLTAPDLAFNFIQASFAPNGNRELDHEPGMTLAVNPCLPRSRGSIHICSPDPEKQPAIVANPLSHPLDCATTIAGVRIGRRIVENAVFDKLRGLELQPGRDIESDDDIIAYAREQGQTTHHIAGTCRMGVDRAAVVDQRLRVNGLLGLRVVDASVFPTSLSGSIGATVMAIAEKAADMIIEDEAKGLIR